MLLRPPRPRSAAGHSERTLHTTNLLCHYVCDHRFAFTRCGARRRFTNTVLAAFCSTSTATIAAVPTESRRRTGPATPSKVALKLSHWATWLHQAKHRARYPWRRQTDQREQQHLRQRAVAAPHKWEFTMTAGSLIECHQVDISTMKSPRQW